MGNTPPTTGETGDEIFAVLEVIFLFLFLLILGIACTNPNADEISGKFIQELPFRLSEIASAYDRLYKNPYGNHPRSVIMSQIEVFKRGLLVSGLHDGVSCDSIDHCLEKGTFVKGD